ncbi:glycosyltransferase family protein [Niabella beijingensis]|uniref:glycosyltransferase family protein n=1 Tax=Niabella beijingensis TaxID=2872700 RepID=UPI001CBAB7C4|nr:glycosyltransferase family protein [Niabella beijingensis]MBZ4189559.1 glycosyl transferase [Niabella beijingensis]
MKIFYAVQATGNGHISRAMELLPYLKQYGTVDIFLSGNNSNLRLDAPVKYRSKGLSLYYTCNGGLNYWQIARHINPIALKKEINALPVADYDLVINDYEYITSAACKAKDIFSVNFGHQASFQSDKVPRPETLSKSGEWMLKHYSKGKRYLGLHFRSYDEFILTPVIKKEILDAQPVDKGHITVYLPSYCEAELKQIFSRFRDFRFEVFSRQAAAIRDEENIRFIPVDKALFNKSLISCRELITGGGFETPSEALHLGKKLMAIPIRGQYEQCCNAAALKEMGIMTLSKIGEDFEQQFEKWQNEYKPVRMDYSQTIPQSMERLFG